MSYAEFTVSEVAERIKSARSRGRKVCVLIGAGASYSAGIGLASDFVADIRQKHAIAFKRACRLAKRDDPSYGECMAQLSEAERTDLVRDQIKRAKLNWAHIGIARLEEQNYLDRILTTNFDPLASRACALFNRFPAVYDLASLREDENRHIQFKPQFVEGAAIYHLHGQHTGFLLLNTDEKLQEQARRVQPVLHEAMSGRLVIVCGYSGHNDPLIERIADIGSFSNTLVWVVHNDASPSEYVCKTLLNKFEDCVVVKNKNSDQFFQELTRDLELAVPKILYNPLDFYGELLDTICPYPAQPGEMNLLEIAKSQLLRASEKNELADLTQKFAEERFMEIINDYRERKSRKKLPLEENSIVAWSAKKQGDIYTGNMPNSSLDDLNAAEDCYELALDLKPDMWTARLNLALIYTRRAEISDAPEQRKKLLQEAIKTVSAVIEVEETSHKAWFNLGWIYAALAKNQAGEERQRSLRQSCDAYKHSVDLDPGAGDAFYNLAASLKELAAESPDSELKDLTDESIACFKEAGRVLGQTARSLAMQASVLLVISTRSTEADAKKLYPLVYDQYEEALRLDRRFDQAAHNWGVAILEEATRESDTVRAKELYKLAAQKFAQAVNLNPDRANSFVEWGAALLGQARFSTSGAARSIMKQAEEKLRAAEALKPGLGCYNLACLFARKGDASSASSWLMEGIAQSTILSKEEILNDSDFKSIINNPLIIEILDLL